MRTKEFKGVRLAVEDYKSLLRIKADSRNSDRMTGTQGIWDTGGPVE